MKEKEKKTENEFSEQNKVEVKVSSFNEDKELVGLIVRNEGSS